MQDSILNTPELNSAQESSYSATESANQMASDAFKMPDLLRQAVYERFKNSPLHGQFQGAAQNFLTAVPQKRAELASMVQGGGPILNPNQQQSILAGTRAANLVPLISLNDLLKSQTGGMETLIQGGTNAYNAQVAAAQAAAELKQQQYKDILANLVQEKEWQMEQQKIDKPTSSSGGGIGDELTKLIMQRLMGQQQIPSNFGNAPMYSPFEGVGTISQDGNWYFSGEDNEYGGWLPIVE
jgi:hypothetical protein